MKTGKRLAWHYGGQWILIGAILLLSVFIALGWMVDRMNELELNRNFMRNGWGFVSNSISIDDEGRVRWDDELLNRVNTGGGWLQIVNEKGVVIKSYNVPPDVPNHYASGEITAYSEMNVPFPYHLSIYVTNINNHMITVLFGTDPSKDGLLERWLTTRTKGTEDARAEADRMLRDEKAWVQRINVDGTELESWRKPDGGLSQYAAYDIGLRNAYPERYGWSLSYLYVPETKETWLLHRPHIASETSIRVAGFAVSSDLQLIWIAITGIILLMVTVFVGMAWWQSARLARPLQHIMNWTGQIQIGNYKEPVNARGVPRSQKSSGKWKRNYRIYGDVIHALERMAQRLQEAEEARKGNERLREEWLAGISHDMKTPLASIIGYAHLLNAPQYRWSEQEIAEFANMMKQKAEVMDELIQELNLTYRLQSGSLPLQLEIVDLRDWLREELRHLQPLPENAIERIVCSMPEEEVLFSLDPRYFRRMIDNVCANVFLHNSQETMLHVQVTRKEQELEVMFSDDGNGMDEQTLSNLFNRYYRGTSTDESVRGSGLGMAIAKQLAELHGGTVIARSKLGEGTSIIFTFPASVDS